MVIDDDGVFIFPAFSYLSRSVTWKVSFFCFRKWWFSFNLKLGFHCLHQLQWQRAKHFDSLLVLFQHAKFVPFQCLQLPFDFSAPPFQRKICNITSKLGPLSFFHAIRTLCKQYRGILVQESLVVQPCMFDAAVSRWHAQLMRYLLRLTASTRELNNMLTESAKVIETSNFSSRLVSISR